MVDVQVNVLEAGRAKTDINCLSNLFLLHSLPCFHAFYFCTFCLVRERVVRLRAWAQSFPRDHEIGYVIRIQERKGFLSVYSIKVCKDGEGRGQHHPIVDCLVRVELTTRKLLLRLLRWFGH